MAIAKHSKGWLELAWIGLSVAATMALLAEWARHMRLAWFYAVQTPSGFALLLWALVFALPVLDRTLSRFLRALLHVLQLVFCWAQACTAFEAFRSLQQLLPADRSYRTQHETILFIQGGLVMVAFMATTASIAFTRSGAGKPLRAG